MFKITVVGAGSVGSTIAYSLAVQSLASEIVLVDINTEKALGEAMDIRQGMPFCGPVRVYAGSYADSKDSDIVVITSGIARRPGQTRIDLCEINVGIIKSVAESVVKHSPNAIYVIVSNPVDILTHAFVKYSGLPENQIIGSGTILDTSRLKARISEYYDVSQKNIHAFVLGEHGDTSFVPWSLATVAGQPIDRYKKFSDFVEELPEFDRDEAENYVRTSGAKVIKRKGATFYAIALAVCHICKAISYSTETILTVSAPLHGEYGIEDVSLSLMTEVGRKGHGRLITPELTDEELKKLHNSADALKAIIKELKI